MKKIKRDKKNSEIRQKDEFWWIHPNLRGKGSLNPGELPGIPYDSYLWVNSSNVSEVEDDSIDRALPPGEGNYAELAKVLFKLNSYRPGPVRGWYIVVCIKPDRAWAVGQMMADSFNPIRVFSDLVFKTEKEARNKAEELRKQKKEDKNSNLKTVAGPYIKKMAVDGIENERKFKAKLAGHSKKKKKLI